MPRFFGIDDDLVGDKRLVNRGDRLNLDSHHVEPLYEWMYTGWVTVSPLLTVSLTNEFESD